MMQSLSFRRFAERAFKADGRTLCVDLRHCTHVDSTFVGTLLYLLKALKGDAVQRLRLISPTKPCLDALEQMGVLSLFNTSTFEEDVDGSTWNEMGIELEDDAGFRRNILQAHEELAKVPGPCSEAFRAVVRCMEKDLENK